MKRISSKEIGEALGKVERINLLLTPQQKGEIRAAAERYGLSMTDYLMRLHALVESHSREPHRRR
jgi:uncharacterized protein (DUF1778 family)